MENLGISILARLRVVGEKVDFQKAVVIRAISRRRSPNEIVVNKHKDGDQFLAERNEAAVIFSRVWRPDICVDTIRAQLRDVASAVRSIPFFRWNRGDAASVAKSSARMDEFGDNGGLLYSHRTGPNGIDDE